MPAKFAIYLLIASALVSVARAADPVPVRITVIADLDDDIYNARAGRGGVDATRMAGADFGGSVLGRPVVVDALNDHNKAGEAPGLANQAYDAGADLLMDLQNAPTAAAISKVATERHRLAISTNAANPALTRAACSRYFYHYSYDLPAIASASANYLAAQAGNTRWVMVAADSGFGKGTAAMPATTWLFMTFTSRGCGPRPNWLNRMAGSISWPPFRPQKPFRRTLLAPCRNDCGPERSEARCD